MLYSSQSRSGGTAMPLRGARFGLIAATAIFCMLIAAGCGGGGGGGSSPGGGGGNQAQAQTDLNNIINGTNQPTTANTGHVAGEWQALFSQNPNNPTDAAGFALSEAAFAGDTFDGDIGGPQPQAAKSKKAQAAAAQALRLNNFGQALALWRLPSIISGGSSISWPNAIDFLPASVAGGGFTLPNGSQLQTDLANLDASLAQVERALAVDLANPTFTFTIPDPINHSNTNGLKLGQAEFNLLYAIVAALRGVINPTLAYNFNDPGYSTITGLYSIAQAQMSINGSTIPPSIYMPASPFLTLNPNGATNMATSKTELTATATHGVSAITEIENRDNSGFLLNPGTFVTNQELNNISTQIQAFQNDLNGDATVTVINGDGNAVSTTMDLNAWFTNPPANLIAFEPTYHVVTTTDAGSSTGFDTTLTLAAIDFPDLTFGGLFPNGFPTPTQESNNVIGPLDPTSQPAFHLLFVSSDSLGWLSPGLNWNNYIILEGFGP